MPYEVKAVNGDGYNVVNSETGEVKANHDTKEEAERQVRLLHMIEEGRDKE
jgi:hypothetical protein